MTKHNSSTCIQNLFTQLPQSETSADARLSLEPDPIADPTVTLLSRLMRELAAATRENPGSLREQIERLVYTLNAQERALLEQAIRRPRSR